MPTFFNSIARWRHEVRWLLPPLWMAAIFVVSGTPSERIPRIGAWDLLLKKGGHMAAYALLAFLWVRPWQHRLPAARAGCLALVLTVLYAISDEYHQTFVPGRDGSVTDVLVDAAGACLALWLWWRYGGKGRECRGDDD